MDLCVCPVLDRDAGAVGPPEDFTGHMPGLFVVLKRIGGRAGFDRDGLPAGIGVVDELMHIPADQGVGGCIAEQACAGGVGEGAAALFVDAVDAFGDGIEE